MKNAFKQICLAWTIVLVWSSTSLGQVDPASQLLLRGRDSTNQDYNSRRYTVKPKSKSKSNQAEQVSEINQGRVQAKDNLSEDPTGQKPPRTLLSETATESSASAALNSSENEELSESLRDSLWGGSNENISSYKKLLHNKDFRRNTIEFGLAPGYYYLDSSSRYWFRSHHSGASGLEVFINVWFTPFFGLVTSYETTFGANIRANPEGSKYIEVDHSWFNAGLRFRSFFGLSRKAPSLNFGVDYNEYQFDVPSDSAQRFSSRSQGVRLSLETLVPKSNTYSWMLGVEMLPNLGHEENKSSVDINSGTGTSSDAFGVWIGGKFTYDRKNRFFWKLSHRVEKNNFTGEADTLDPLSGIQPEGVSVTNSTTKFQLGFTWGR